MSQILVSSLRLVLSPIILMKGGTLKCWLLLGPAPLYFVYWTLASETGSTLNYIKLQLTSDIRQSPFVTYKSNDKEYLNIYVFFHIFKFFPIEIPRSSTREQWRLYLLCHTQFNRFLECCSSLYSHRQGPSLPSPPKVYCTCSYCVVFSSVCWTRCFVQGSAVSQS